MIMTKLELPKNLHPIAEKYVRNIHKYLTEKGMVESCDAVSFYTLAQNYSTYLKATDQCGDEFTIINRQGNVVANPLIKIANDAQIRAEKMLAKLPLSPWERKKLLSSASSVEEEESLLEQFIKK